ncbi:hypothetical protein QCA50_012203 [Cerrena zonata]|uniref:Aminopeptidase P N-terminal domain-containing protein n=1 Tax=Cerrena zonata TaxID=2478898 RepID=A0AAW0FWR0_9APHY
MSSVIESVKGHKYPAKAHAENVVRHLQSKISSAEADKTAVFISGEDLELYQYCDQTKPVRQNRYFFYLTGCDIPGSHVLYQANKKQLTLYLPDIDYDDVMWSGLPLSLADAGEKYDVDQVKYASELKDDLASLKGYSILTTDINQFNSKYQEFLIAGDENLFYALDESRMIKDWYEIELMKHAAKITDKCHLAVMSALPIETNETHIHAEFMYHAIRQGSKHQSYDPICCSGPSCSTLHYVKNDDEIDEKKRSILIDAGAEWQCYASDVTRCFPINGDWSKEHLDIYNLVLKMQQETMKLIKPGALWDDIHLHAHKVMVEGFINLGIFKKEYSVQEILKIKYRQGSSLMVWAIY